MGTSIKRTTNVEDMSEIGKSYHMPSFVVDGMSVESVHEAIEEASARARKGEGPTLLDIRTYRYKGHSMSDPQKYRTKDEVEDFKGKDPVSQVLNTITANKLASESDIKKIQEEVKVLVDESIVFAEESPELEPHELYEDVYMQKDYPFIKD
jgi:pyruvate dehydrogenase E1 component alpha subunit